jgi:hypothetical protein
LIFQQLSTIFFRIHKVMISDAITMARKKRLHTIGIVFLLGVFVLADAIVSGRWVQAETSSKPLQICSEIVYQGYVSVRKIVKLGPQTLSNQEALDLDALLQTAQFFSLPGVISSPKVDGCCDRGLPDFRITVVVAKKKHTVAINTQNVASPQNLVPLLRWLETRAESRGGAQGDSSNEKCSD